MPRPNNNGWDFVKQGEVYQYKEDSLIAMVIILNDNSDDRCYDFDIEILQANFVIPDDLKKFNVYATKGQNRMYSSMSQFYEKPEYLIMLISMPYPYEVTMETK